MCNLIVYGNCNLQLLNNVKK